MSAGNLGVVPALVDEIIALPTLERQAKLLRDNGLLGAEGLDRVLDLADRLLNDDPGKARRVAELCAGLAAAANAPAAVPRAAYVRAGAHNLNGEFEEDLRLTKLAHDGYVALGMNLEALRTNVGKMAALLELGRYGEALEAGQVVTDALGGTGELEVSPTPRESDLLTALVHQNRGGCYEYMGRYDEALEAYAAAEDTYRALGMVERLSEIISDRGAVLLLLGRGREALSAHQVAAASLEEAGLAFRHAQALANTGETQLHLGAYKDSLDAFERARLLLDSLDTLSEDGFLLRNTADAYLALNLYSEALVTYRRAVELLRGTGMAHDQAQALWGMGSALIARLELEEAEEVLTESAELFGRAGNVPLLSGVMLEQASLQATRGDGSASLTTARRALEIVSQADRPVQQVYARLRLADLLLSQDASAAEHHLLSAQQLADRLALPQLRFRLNERLGHLRRVQGRSDEALTLLAAAVDEIEHLRGAVAQDAMRTSFLRDKTAAYEDLLLLHLDKGDEGGVGRAFAVAERAKSRALVDLLTGVVERVPVGSADPSQERQIQTSQADLNAIYSELLGDPGNGARPVLVRALRARATELEAEISRLRLHFVAAGPSSDPFASPVLPEDALNQLPPETVLLAYHIVGGEIMAFVNARGRIRIARNLSTVDKVNKLSRKLDVQWERFRAGREFAGRHATMLERSTQQVLRALYDELVAPLETLLREAAARASSDATPKVAVVSHGTLHGVPFHALFDGERYLIERFEIAYAPSAIVYALCQKRVSGDRNGAVVFGVDDPRIPAAAVEARAVATHLFGAEVRVGDSATVEALRAAASRSGTLHLACHGMFRSDNPMFSSLKLQDSWLLAADVMGLDLAGALITLSACESGRNEVIGGDEVLGLSRAFLGAGAATLVVSLWLVQDDTTAELMGDWYRRLRSGEGRVAALRAAQLDLKKRYPHPYHWAPFVLVGKR